MQVLVVLSAIYAAFLVELVTGVAVPLDVEHAPSAELYIKQVHEALAAQA